jgi:hypothetical protein
MVNKVLNGILCVFLGASLVNIISLIDRKWAAKKEVREGDSEDGGPHLSPKQAWRQSLFVTSFQGFLIVYVGYKVFAGIWSWPVGTIALLGMVWLIRKPLSQAWKSRPVAVRSSKNLHLVFPSTESVTLEYIAGLIASDSVMKAINADLVRTDRIGHKEPWSLCLITSGQDRFDPRVFALRRQEALKGWMTDRALRTNLMERVPVERVATLHSATWFGYRANNVLITAARSLRSHSLSAKTKAGEFTRIRDLQIHPVSAGPKSTALPQFLRESGFPLRHAYPDGDPLTTERGGTIVGGGGEVIVIYPKYFVQRRVIDDDGALVYLGLNEEHEDVTQLGIQLRPSTSALLLKCASYHGYTPIVRYRSFPYASDHLLPLLDTPISDSGWADLFIDTRGRAKLFVAKDRTLPQWCEMLEELRQLLYAELARKDYHLLGLTRDPTHLNEYMVKKQAILAMYYHTEDFVLWEHGGGGPGQSRVAATPAGQQRWGVIQDTPVPKRPQVRTYRYEQAGFEIDLPADWSPDKGGPTPFGKLVAGLRFGWDPHVDGEFRRGANETLNVVIEPMSPEPGPYLTRQLFSLTAPRMGYEDCQYGTISVGGKPHTCVRYTIGGRAWCKKYLLVLDGKGYAVTASCDDPDLFSQREKVWDTIASSLRVVKSSAEI